MKLLSMIIPCYNEEASIPIYCQAMAVVMDKLRVEQSVETELIFVDDGSSDKTLSILRDLHQNDPHIKYLSFSRNFGKESAMLAGLDAAAGDFVGVMDVDLQDPPELLEQMVAELKQGEFDCVATRRVTRTGEPPIRSFFARLFYKLINRLSDTEIVDGARDYRVMNRKMVDAVLKLREVNRFTKGLFSWVGFKTKWLTFENVERAAGETKWSFFKLMRFALEGIVSFSTAPLAISTFLGFIICLVSFILICFYVIKTLIYGDPVSGFPTLISIILFMGGVQLFCIGILGQYLSKTYTETKHRPIYLVAEASDDEKTA